MKADSAHTNMRRYVVVIKLGDVRGFIVTMPSDFALKWQNGQSPMAFQKTDKRPF